MTVYGNFEAIKKVFTSHHSTIWSARTAGTTESADCAVKVIEVNPALEGDTALAQNLLVASAMQQAMGNKSAYWAPVYGLGSQGHNAFYVSRLYPRSAQSLIDFKINLTSAELKALLLEVVEGLMDLDAGFHRSHGNLKPTNVLISDRSKIRKGGVLLTDPDSSNEDIPSLTRTPDSKAIGELLYGLVTHKPHTTARWPLQKSSHWRKLGSSGRQWFAFCDDLLNTVSRRGLPTLERIREKIEAINPSRRQIPGAVIGLVLLGCVGAGAYVERAKLPGWYKQAHEKVMALLPAPAKKPVPTTEPAVAKIPPATMQSVIASNVVPEKPPAVSTSQAVIADRTPVALPTPTPVLPLPPVAVLPAPPKPITPVLPAPPQLPARVDDNGTNLVKSYPPPEFHSDPARAEFLVRRDKFVADYAAFGSALVLTDWTQILAKVQGLEADFPPLDPGSTVGWPAGLAGVMNVRRDTALVRKIDAAFDKRRGETESFQQSEGRVQKAVKAVIAAREALARGDIPTAEKSIELYRAAIKSFPLVDADLVDLFAPVNREFSALTEIESSSDRSALVTIADNEGAPLAIRVAAWFRLSGASNDPWPIDMTAMIAEEVRAERLKTLLVEAGSIGSSDQITAAEQTRRDAFFARLKDEPAVLAALHESTDPHFAGLVTKAPVWFRYDAALYTLKTIGPSRATDDQKKLYTDLAGQVDAPGVQLVRNVLQEAQTGLPPSLSQSGPGSIRGWALRGGWTRDHCTFVSPAGTDTLEFLRVHVPDDPDGIDCYLSTTEAPVSLLRHLLNGNLTAYTAVKTLNTSTVLPKPGMRVWSFDDSTGSVNLDDSDYRKCFIVSPSDALPMQFVTPQTSFYLARRVGCRLPTSREWLAALSWAQNSTDTNIKGFATTGFRLRDRQYSRLLTNPNRDPHYWPDDNIFLGDLNPDGVPHGSRAAIWSATDLLKLSGRTEAPAAALWPLSSLAASSGYGFRTVGDTDNYAGVFHDLIGNVAEYTMDAPVILAERVDLPPSLQTDDVVRKVNEWCNAEHLKGVSIIGGSAMSPPGLDPNKPFAIPVGGPTVFSDVGFRLAFTDPTSVPNAQKSVISQASYLTAP